MTIMGRNLRPMNDAERKKLHQFADAVERLRQRHGPSLDDLSELFRLAPGFETTAAARMALALWSTWGETKRQSEWLAFCWAVEIWRVS